MKKEDGFEQRERVAKLGYWDDPRWKEVEKLRRKKEHAKANGLVFAIRDSWGVD